MLKARSSPEEREKTLRYFKNTDGDQFIGVRMGQVFANAKEFIDMTPGEIEKLLDSKIHEAAILLPDGADDAALELAILEAVVLAETKCHADWTMVQTLMGHLPEGEARAAFQAAVDQVEEQEDEHIRWARQTWEQLILTQAQSSGLPR